MPMNVLRLGARITNIDPATAPNIPLLCVVPHFLNYDDDDGRQTTTDDGRSEVGAKLRVPARRPRYVVPCPLPASLAAFRLVLSGYIYNYITI